MRHMLTLYFALAAAAVVIAFSVATRAGSEKYCYHPYSTPVLPEHLAKRTFMEVIWLDQPRGIEAKSAWAYDEETETSICRIWVRMPNQILGDPDMDSLGHETLHCLTGDFHPEDN